MSTLDERVWQLRNGIIQRLNNPEGLQEEEVDALICAAQAEGAEQERERIRRYAKPIDNFFNQMSLVIPNAVLSLAPKEPTIYAVGDNGEGGESHSATSSGDHWEQKLVHGPEIAGLG